MPRPRRYTRQRQADPANNPRVLHYLLAGYSYHFLDPTLGPDDAGEFAAALEVAWREANARLIKYHVFGPDVVTDFAELRLFGNASDDVPPRPGTRCWGWWHYAAPEPRRWVGDGPEPKPDPELFERIEGPHREGRRWGVPVFLPERWCFGDPDPAGFESQRDYIDRLGLWLRGERRLLAEVEADGEEDG